MAGGATASPGAAPFVPHSAEFRRRRFLNWFPLGLTYALLYMGRYNLTVAKTSLGDLMTKEDFGLIFGAGTFAYFLAFWINGPLVDRIGGRAGMLIAAIGTIVANLAMGSYLYWVLESGTAADAPLRLVFATLYSVNMYFQSYGAVSIVKVNAHWFHVAERGGFSGIFGTMISSGIFLAFTVNEWFLDLAKALWADRPSQWVVFFAPAVLLVVLFFVELFLLRDRPSQAGHQDFDTGDADSGVATDGKPQATKVILKKIFSHPVIITIALIEFCTGVLRQGVMHWFPIYAREVWVLPKAHALIAGWGVLLFVAGVLGGNIAGWISDLVFQSRRGPVAAVLYGATALACIGMVFSLATPAPVVGVADPKSGLQAGDRIVSIAGKDVRGWADVRPAIACWPAVCKASTWDAGACVCSTKAVADPSVVPSDGTIPARIERGGTEMELAVADPLPVQRAGDKRVLKEQPVLPLSPWVMGFLLFVVSVAVIGTHGVLSGTATMDFGGRQGAATAVAVIDGAVYMGTALQSVSLGYLTTLDWQYWPIFLVPFTLLGLLLCTRIWNAKPRAHGMPATQAGASPAGQGGAKAA